MPPSEWKRIWNGKAADGASLDGLGVEETLARLLAMNGYDTPRARVTAGILDGPFPIVRGRRA